MRRDEFTLPEPPPTDRPGDRWLCGRSSDQSPCLRGPTSAGMCPLADACRPRRTWHGLRIRITTITAAILVAILLMVLCNGWNSTVLKPGELSTPHAQILAGTLESQRCASCHPQAATSTSDWFSTAQAAHANVTQTDQCLNCHHTTISRPTAKLAHNLLRGVREELRSDSIAGRDRSWHDLLPGPAVDQEDIHCSACHREHRGANADLLDVSDSQCQTCHTDRFGSFATSHPDWQRWPYGRSHTIAFNHTSHARKHFPATVRGTGVAQFQCTHCHARTTDNELTRSTSYQQACQTCHEDALRMEAAEGIELLALPTLPSDSAERVPPWPFSATGFYDGKLSPMTELLIRGESDTASAIRRLPDRDFAKINDRDVDEVAAGETIASASRRLLRDIAVDGQQAIIDRASESGIASSTLTPWVRSLSPQLVGETYGIWFNTANRQTHESALLQSLTPSDLIHQAQFEDLSIPPTSLLTDKEGEDPDGLLLAPSGADDKLLSSPSSHRDDLLSNDGLLSDGTRTGVDPLAIDANSLDQVSDSSKRGNFLADRMMPAGGWYRDDLRMAIRYRGGGHDDPVLKSTVEWISQLPVGDPARENLLKNRAIAACVACHPGAISGDQAWGSGTGKRATAMVSAGSDALAFAERWRSEPLIGRKSEFTKFSHGPHLNVATLADCSHCHQIGNASPSNIHLNGNTGHSYDFEPLSRQACAACHTPHAAGDACVKCHRYHIDLR